MILAERLAQAAALIAEVRDVVEGRVVSPEPPPWCVSRGWEAFLLGLSEDTLRRCEEVGLVAELPALPDAPASLLDLGRRIEAVTALPESPEPEAVRPLHNASERKRGQVATLVRLCRERLGRCTRMIDVGSGRGHLTRELALALEVPSLGLERDPSRVARADALNAGDGPAFEARDLDDAALRFEPGDLAVGLHACGSLGDDLVRAAARDQVDLLLVNCCLQHVPGDERAPLSAAGQALSLAFGRRLLGLTNLTSGRRLVEGNHDQVRRDRRTRYGLSLLLRARGLDLVPGAEMRGMHRRHVKRGLTALATRACERRKLAPPTPKEIARFEIQSEEEYGALQRLSLPRAMLGRVLEVAVVLDRALVLEEAGHTVTVERVFSLDLSPRNLGIVAKSG